MKRWIKGLLCVAVLAAGVLAAGAFPLKVDIDVTTKRSRQQIGSGDDGDVRLENVIVKVKIRKSGGDIPEGKLSAELYVIGKQIQTGNYGIIDVKKGEFELLKENDYTFKYESPTYTMGKTDGVVNVGGEYETYLVVVSGPDGEIIDWRCGRAIREEGVAFIRELGPMTMFDRDGNVLGKLENPGEALKEAIPAATAQDTDDGHPSIN